VIEDIPKEFFHSITFRYASQEDSIKVLLEMDLQPETIGDMLAFLRDRHRGDSRESLLDKPFEPKPQLTPQPTRFSDGTIRVFYSALEADTAEVEVRDWYLRHAFGSTRERRTVYYMSFSCDYAGHTKDLRPYVATLPCLIQDEKSAYPDCHRIAAEAVKDGLGGLLTPSARKPGGTCLPVFRRKALSNPRRREWVAFAFDPETGQVSPSRIS
jgi:hypothetical protein